MPVAPVIWWLRRDLRLADNPALTQALAASPTVIPLFILDPALLNSRYHHKAQKRQAFLFASLKLLDADLRSRGSRLIVRSGPPLKVLTSLVGETQATAIFAAEDYSPYARQRDTGWHPLHRIYPLQPGLEGAPTAHPGQFGPGTRPAQRTAQAFFIRYHFKTPTVH
jgi:deoxyribodipyrimidine photo-lyase